MSPQAHDEAGLDIAAIVEQIRQQVRRDRQGRLDSSVHQLESSFDEVELARSLEEVRANRAVSAHWPIVYKTPLQMFFAFLQRLTRRFLRWYINPIVEQQNAYNASLERTVSLLVAANARLREEILAMHGRLRALEEHAGLDQLAEEGTEDAL
ncbi:MAG: hypothetical protein JXA37_01505 [Chloroflexia bacterium]|nr:hypothetical protein [Chloroflexia bacterium]